MIWAGEGFRAALVVALFLAVAIFELLLPAHRLRHAARGRWFENIALHLMNSLLSRGFWSFFGAGVAAIASEHRVGLFHRVEVPVPIVVVVSIVLFDLSAYLLHRTFHRAGWMWRIHRVHHSDLDLDLTTGIRFHPLEAVCTIFVYLLLVALLGVPLSLVLLWGLIVYATGFIGHGNVRLPAALERPLRWVFVTPQMHEIHHSTDESESNANYGSLLSIWDRLFGTYVAASKAGQGAMDYGLAELRDPAALSFRRLLRMPAEKALGSPERQDRDDRGD